MAALAAKSFSVFSVTLWQTLIRKIEIRATHKIMTARTTQFAFLVDQFMAALRTKPPVLAGNVFRNAGIRFESFCNFAF
jgi:hypothetical protein